MSPIPRIALVVMPYYSVRYGSIQCGLLKSYLRTRGIEADVFYFNLSFARRAGWVYYEALAHGNRFLPEWSFAQAFLGRRSLSRLHARKRLRQLEQGKGFDPRRYWDLLGYVEDFLDECRERVDWSSYALIGFSSCFYSQFASLALARRIKERHPEVPVVFGGMNVEGPMGLELLRSFPWVDYVVDGEGEESLARLVHGMGDGGTGRIPGVARRCGGQILPPLSPSSPVSLDELPFVDYGDYFEQLRLYGLEGQFESYLYFEASRGCWWGEKRHCLFCGISDGWMKYRSKSPEHLLKEVDFLIRKYRILSLHATDNILNLKYLDTFIPKLKNKIQEDGISLNLFFETKSNLRRSQVAELKSSGVYRLQPGIESLHSEILRLMAKGVKAIQNLQTLRACREFDMSVEWLFIYGFPGEEPGWYRQILDLLPKITHLQPPERFQPVLLDRSSPYFVEPERWGITSIQPKEDYGFLYPDGVDLGNVAYRFDYQCLHWRGNPEEYVASVREFLRRWQQDLFGRTFFYYVRGPGFVWLYDYRLRSPGDSQPTFRRLLLEGWRAEAYCFCVEIKTAAEITSHLEKSGHLWKREDLAEILEEWEEEGLMLSEQGQYLSLALPLARDPKTFFERCQMLGVLETEALHV